MKFQNFCSLCKIVLLTTLLMPSDVVLAKVGHLEHFLGEPVQDATAVVIGSK